MAADMEQQGENMQAEDLYAKIPDTEPEWAGATFRLGYLRLQRSDFAGAVQAFESCLVKREQWPEAQLNLGIANWKMGDADAARKAFEQVLAATPQSPDA